jgi:YVTN family beta-propeller protein
MMIRPAWGLSALLLVGLVPGEPRDRSPLDLALSGDGRWALTANSTSDSVSLVDLTEGKVVAEEDAGTKPFSVAWRGAAALVTNLLDETVTLLDVVPPKLTKVATIDVGYQPRGVALWGDRAYVALSGEDAVAVLDLRTKAVVGRVPVGLEPWYVALTPDGARLLVGNTKSQDLSVVETSSLKVITTVDLKGRNLRHITVSPDGAWAYLPQIVDRNGPTTVASIEDGKVIDNRLVRVPLSAPGPREALPLDTKGFASGDMEGVALSPDGQQIAISIAGTRTLLLLRLPLPFTAQPKDHMDESLHQDAVRYRRVLGLRGRPLGLSFTPDGKSLVVANALRNEVQRVDVEKADVVQAVSLGGPAEASLARKGEAIFYDAYRSWHEWFSCATCHVEGHENGGLYDTFNDGKYGNPKKVLSLRGVSKTGPWTWHGHQANLGQSLQGSFTRTMGRGALNAEELKAVLAYLDTLDFVPPPKASHTEAAKRGEAVFKAKGCASCHKPPLYTDKEIHLVGLESPDDVYRGFNPPSLRGIGRRMPYLHDGRAKTLDEVLRDHHRPSDLGGAESDPTPEERADLVAFLKSL